MNSLDVARWQFGITTVYHFVLVPLTIGIAPLVALMQTLWVRTGKDHWLKLTNFFGKIFLINFALGVSTGIVQEFQFGMNWSNYSRMVGDIFGAPLAIEALAAFFLESTFIGLWIFGKNRLSKKLHTLSIWLAAIGVNLSAYWILVANSFMQNPVGAKIGESGRAQVDGVSGFLTVITQPLAISTFFHTVTVSLLTAGTVIAGLSGWWIVRSVRAGNETEAREIWKPGAKFGMITVVISGILVGLTGHHQAQLMIEYQPMKMAAAEALYDSSTTEKGAPFTIAAFGSEKDSMVRIGEVPGLLSFLGTNKFSGEGSQIKGIDELQKEYKERFKGTKSELDNYQPPLMVTFWTFRLMIAVGMLSTLIAAWGLYKLRKDRLTDSKSFGKLFMWMIPTPFLGSSFGWIFTEIGRQPWIVHPNVTEAAASGDGVARVHMLTQNGLSQVVDVGTVLTSLIIFTLLYAALGVVWFWLIRRYTLEGINTKAVIKDEPTDAPMSFAY